MTDAENLPKISTAQLFCVLMLSRLSAEIIYPRSGAGCGAETMLAVITAELVRFVLGLPVIIYAFKKTRIYRSMYDKNRFFGIACALGAGLLLASAAVKTLWALAEFSGRNLAEGAPVWLLGCFAAALAVYTAYSGAEALSRSGALILAIAAVVTLGVILACIPHMELNTQMPAPRREPGVFLGDVFERILRGGDYLIFAALLPYVRVKKVSAPATATLFAFFSALAAVLLSGFYCLVLRELYGLVEFPMPAAASLADVGFFRRLDGGASAIWALGAAYRAGLLLFSIRAVYAQVRGGKGAQVAARDGA